MGQMNVTFELQTADRTRRAQVTLPRSKNVSDVIKASRKRWAMGFGVDYQIANLTTGRQLLPNEPLSFENVHDGDKLMLQPFPTHGTR